MHSSDLIKHKLISEKLPLDVIEGVEIDIKYSGYLQRQKAQIEQFQKQRKRLLSSDIDYNSITTLSQEAREKLTDARPPSLGHAADLPGVSKADLSALLIWLKLEKLREIEMPIKSE